jgi:hypothetical protein
VENSWQKSLKNFDKAKEKNTVKQSEISKHNTHTTSILFATSMRDKSAKRRIKREKQKEELTKEGMVSEDIDRSEIKQYVMKYFKKEWKMIVIS